MSCRPLFAIALMLPTLAAAAPTCTATSGATVPAVVELYTSEGCDSCPPADRWLTSLKSQAERGSVLPLAFHIDYWDYLGWKDPYADPAFGARHREAASRGGAKVIYTPQVLYDGREFQQWRRTPAQKVPVAGPKAARAELRVAASPAGAGRLQVTIAGKALRDARGGEAWVAVFESDLASDVRAGENKGVVLRHDFVVRRWLGPYPFARGALDVSQTIELPPALRLANAGVAVVAKDDNGAVLQALALPLRDCAG